jgi:hypothetical protein
VPAWGISANTSIRSSPCRYYAIDKAEPKRLLRAEPVAGKDEAHLRFLADEPGQTLQSAFQRGHADARLGQAEPGAFVGEDDVASERQFEAAATAIPLTAATIGLVMANRRVRPPKPVAGSAVAVAKVAARAKGAVALAGQNLGPNAVIRLESVDQGGKLGACTAAERVAALGKAQREEPDGAEILHRNHADAFRLENWRASVRPPYAAVW